MQVLLQSTNVSNDVLVISSISHQTRMEMTFTVLREEGSCNLRNCDPNFSVALTCTVQDTGYEAINHIVFACLLKGNNIR